MDELQRLIIEIRDRGVSKRLELGLSRSEVAAAMKRSNQLVHLLETEGPRTLRLVVDWSNALGVTAHSLLSGAESSRKAEQLLFEAVSLLDARTGRRKALAQEARKLLGHE